MVCDICPNACDIASGGVGACLARGAGVVPLGYGRLTSLALDPVEKKPLYHFHLGSMVLSAGSFGCNLRCPWCQNHGISMIGHKEAEAYGLHNVSPEELADMAERHAAYGNIGVAFTYNEPLINFEYVMDTSRILKGRGLKSVLVTNGYANPGRFKELLPYVDAMNIDLKSINEGFYEKIGGRLDIVQENIRAAASRCHVELTCLLIDGENDTEEEMEAMAEFVASVSRDIPLHISRFFPHYRMEDRAATDLGSMRRFEAIAQRRLTYVHLGNV
ncbi:MAG: AmmeMemoRadiSam system radical SAM enzyme [Clostridiales bacterium]|nr:AmmeMemoRadiSam system radical SAM enzyme [Clostridiales bacterium]